MGGATSGTVFTRARRVGALALVVAAAPLWLVTVAGTAAAARPGPALRSPAVAPATRQVSYLGYRFRVPSDWPLLRASGPDASCVRFDRHAVYLGLPTPSAHCPSIVAGHSEALLVEPLSAATVGGTPAPIAVGVRPDANFAIRGSFGLAWLQVPAAGVLVSVSWGRQPGVVRSILAGAGLVAGHAVPAVVERVAPAAEPASSSAGKPAYFKGLGFDECALPSVADIEAWKSSPYRALNIYIGGVNEGCPQKDLTKTWVARVTKLGWSLIPTYVGLQAPKPTCPCATIKLSQALAEGEAAATSAVKEMAALGIGAGNPIYDDMEGYTTGSTNSPAVLKFLDGWSEKLRADKYVSGVYTGADSGVVDLVSEMRSSTYLEPSDIWFADWNGQKNVTVSTIPAADWDHNQRIHQFNGGVNTRYGGVTINVDGDQCDGAVVSASSL